MILAQNRLRLLNGSRIIVMFLLGLFLFSCGTKKPNYRRPTHKKPTTSTKPKKKKSKIDTVEWTEVDKTTSSTKPKSDFKNTTPSNNIKSNYRISIFMPMNGKSSYTEGQDKSTEAYINYYAGMKMALKELESKGASIAVDVYDDNVGFEKTIYSSKFKTSDIIIGPRKKDKLKKVVEIGKREEILVVSPWWTSSKMTEDNPYYLQMNPSTVHRYKALLEHAKKRFSNENIVVIQRELSSDKKRARYFQRLSKSIDGGGSKPIEIFTVSVDSLEQGETAFDELIMPEEERNIAVILPNWSSKDEYYIYSCLRKLSTEKGMNKITVYAMSKVLESDLINFDLYKNLNIRIATEKYINPDDANVKNFRTKYYNEYNAIATNDAIEGYDMMSFIGKNLLKYGNTFPSFVDKPQRMMQIKYNIQGKHSKSDIRNEKYNNVKYYENNHLDIIEFDRDHFVRRR